MCEISNHEKKKFIVNNDKQILTKQISIQICTMIKDQCENKDVFANSKKKNRYTYVDLNVLEEENESLLNDIYDMFVKRINLLKTVD